MEITEITIRPTNEGLVKAYVNIHLSAQSYFLLANNRNLRGEVGQVAAGDFTVPAGPREDMHATGPRRRGRAVQRAY
jgi:hypothetical protein